MAIVLLCYNREVKAMKKYVPVFLLFFCLFQVSCKREETKIYLDKPEEITVQKPTISKPDIGGDDPVGDDVIVCNELDENEMKMPVIKDAWKRKWPEVWSQAILDTFENDKLGLLIDDNTAIRESDLEKIDCVGFKFALPVERKYFWVSMLAAIAYEESSYNPDEDYHESDGTISAGLLQIDKTAANRNCSSFTDKTYSASDMYKPHENLECGLYMMRNQLNGGKTGKRPSIKNHLFITDSYAFYWSVLTSTKRFKVMQHFKDNASTLGFCSRTKPLDLNDQNCIASKYKRLKSIKRLPAQI